MPVYSFRTIQGASQGLYREKGSKFLSFAYPVLGDEDIREKIAALKNEYFDARHHCFAWILGPEKKNFRAFDDGEPNHSAGDPILGQIRSKNLTNTLVVVVRYFGGVKLGVGGLVSAYRMAAENALNKAVIIEQEVQHRLTARYGYPAMPDMMKLIKEFDLIIIRQVFDDDCELEISVPLRVYEKFLERISILKNMGLGIDVLQNQEID